jgi:hypothetical protein
VVESANALGAENDRMKSEPAFTILACAHNREYARGLRGCLWDEAAPS